MSAAPPVRSTASRLTSAAETAAAAYRSKRESRGIDPALARDETRKPQPKVDRFLVVAGEAEASEDLSPVHDHGGEFAHQIGGVAAACSPRHHGRCARAATERIRCAARLSDSRDSCQRHSPAGNRAAQLLGAVHELPRSRSRDPETMAVVSGAACSRACSSLTHSCACDRRRPVRIDQTNAVSSTTTTPAANNPTITITTLFFYSTDQQIRTERRPR